MNTSIVVRIQNKFFNMLAQMNDSQKFTRDVYHYDPHKASLLTGKMANKLIPFNADRLVTPCLDFPNLGLDLVAALAPTACIAGPFYDPAKDVCPVAFINETLGVYEVDMWIPTEGLAHTERRLEDRQIATHEYGHFMMCSMLFDADWKKMRQVPNLIIQRMLDGAFMNSSDESPIVMEAWADYFASQLTGGTNYFIPENSIRSDNTLVNYCEASSSSCLDLNYVEDNDDTHASSTQSVGFSSQIRQTVSILTDAFDGRSFGTNDPNSADIATRSMKPPPLLALSPVHVGDAHDEPVALPGGALRTVVSRWVEMNDVVRWRVNRQQFHEAITQVMSENKVSWCDTCRVYAPHDGKACSLTPGVFQQRGECRDLTTMLPVSATLTTARRPRRPASFLKGVCACRARVRPTRLRVAARALHARQARSAWTGLRARLVMLRRISSSPTTNASRVRLATSQSPRPRPLPATSASAEAFHSLPYASLAMSTRSRETTTLATRARPDSSH